MCVCAPGPCFLCTQFNSPKGHGDSSGSPAVVMPSLPVALTSMADVAVAAVTYSWVCEHCGTPEVVSGREAQVRCCGGLFRLASRRSQQCFKCLPVICACLQLHKRSPPGMWYVLAFA
jgi:hypothetical protein